MTKYYDANGNELPYEQVSSEFTKQSIEFNRYKQDCRKRSLDLAHLEKQNHINPSQFDLIGLADKYYQWLISIPE